MTINQDHELLSGVAMIDGNFFWPEYLEEFNYFTEDGIRPGCYPRKMVHSHPVSDSIVLIHGLTDSPAMMVDLALYYYEDLGYNVYLPLLQCHGLKEPENMWGVSLKKWKENVRFCLHTAAAGSKRVSIGGLSTGGALAFYFGCLDQRINKKIYLFSAALGLYGGWFGTLLEYILGSPLSLVYGRIISKPLIGENPNRYSHVPPHSARELVLLMNEIDGIRTGVRSSYLLEREIFCAWSECDKVIDAGLLAELATVTSTSCFTPFVIDKKHGVAHASVVLKHPIYAMGSQPGDQPLELANPLFEEMAAVINQFAEKA